MKQQQIIKQTTYPKVTEPVKKMNLAVLKNPNIKKNQNLKRNQD